MSSRGRTSASARNSQESGISSRKSTHEELVAASHAVEQELNVVKALKRLSIGNSFNYDPDLPPDESDLIDLNAYIDLNRSPTQRSVASTSSASSSSSKSSASYKRSSLCEEQHVDMGGQYDHGDDQTQESFDDKENKREAQELTRSKLERNALSKEKLRRDQESEVDAEDVILESNKLMWVPATAHPKLAPENFRKYVQETVQEITTKLDKTRSKRSSLSQESANGDNSTGENRNVDRTSDNSSRRTSSSSTSSSRKSRQPSLKELSTELENLSHLAGMDSTDAVTLARTLSSSSLGFTQMEKDLYASSDSALKRTDSPPRSSDVLNSSKSEKSSSSSPDAIDENLPIPTSGIGGGLRRARWTTYRKRGRPNLQKLQSKSAEKQKAALGKNISRHDEQVSSGKTVFSREANRVPVRSFSTPLPSSTGSAINSVDKPLSRTPSSKLPPLPVTNESKSFAFSQKGGVSPKAPEYASKNANTSSISSAPSVNSKHSGWKWLKEKASTRNENQNQKGSDHFEDSTEVFNTEPAASSFSGGYVDKNAFESDKAAGEPDVSTSSTFSSIFHFRSRTSDDSTSQSGKSFKELKTVFGSHRHHKHEEPVKEQIHENPKLDTNIDNHIHQEMNPGLQPYPTPEQVNGRSGLSSMNGQQSSNARHSNKYEHNVPVQSNHTKSEVITDNSMSIENGDSPYQQQSQRIPVSGSSSQQSYVGPQNQTSGQFVDQRKLPENLQMEVHRHHHHQRNNGEHRQNVQYGRYSDEDVGERFNSGMLTQEQSKRQKYQMRVLRQHRHRPSKGQRKGGRPSDRKNISPMQQSEQRRSGTRQKLSGSNSMNFSRSSMPISQSQKTQLSQNENHIQNQASTANVDTSVKKEAKVEAKAKSQLPMVPEPSTEALKRSLKVSRHNTRANQPLEMRDSAFGFPLPPVSKSTLVMLDYRFPIHVERAVYRLSHLKLADPKRPLYQQVLLSNFMYAYLNLVNHTLYLQQQQQEQMFQQQQREIGANDDDYALSGNEQQQIMPNETVISESQDGMVAGSYGVAVQRADIHY